jgi:hypothetical protein
MPEGTPGATPAAPGGIRNLAISSAERSELTQAFMAHKGISLSDVQGAGPLPGSVYYAYDPATGTYWALAAFDPSSTASSKVSVDFQDGGGTGMFRMASGGSWQVQNSGVPSTCSELLFFPKAVLQTWRMPTSAPSGMHC